MRRAQTLIRKGGHPRRIYRTVGDRLQHAPRARPEQIRDEAGQLNMPLPRAAPRAGSEIGPGYTSVGIAPHDRPPQALFRVRHEAEGELLCDEPPHQSFGIGEIFLASRRAGIRLRLRQMQQAGRRAPPASDAAVTTAAIVRSRLLHWFVDLATRAGAILPDTP